MVLKHLAKKTTDGVMEGLAEGAPVVVGKTMGALAEGVVTVSDAMAEGGRSVAEKTVEGALESVADNGPRAVREMLEPMQDKWDHVDILGREMTSALERIADLRSTIEETVPNLYREIVHDVTFYLATIAFAMILLHTRRFAVLLASPNGADLWLFWSACVLPGWIVYFIPKLWAIVRGQRPSVKDIANSAVLRVTVFGILIVIGVWLFG